MGYPKQPGQDAEAHRRLAEQSILDSRKIADLEEKIQRMDSALYQNRFDDWVERDKKLRAEVENFRWLFRIAAAPGDIDWEALKVTLGAEDGG